MRAPTREEYQNKLDQYAHSFKQLGFHVDVRPVEEIVDPWDTDTVVDYNAVMYVDGVKNTIAYDDQLGWYID
jgi:hypothetical protein